jgi:hypothetical protein
MDSSRLKTLLVAGSPEFWKELRTMTHRTSDFEEQFLLSSWRKKAHDHKLPRPGPVVPALKFALVGDFSLCPLHETIFDTVFLDPVALTPAISTRDIPECDSLTQSSPMVAVEEASGFLFGAGEAAKARYVGEFADLILNRKQER